jgi:hypothetical protein
MHKPIVSWPMSTLNWYLKTKSKPEITLGLMYGRTQQKRKKSPLRDNCGLIHKAFTDTKKWPCNVRI